MLKTLRDLGMGMPKLNAQNAVTPENEKTLGTRLQPTVFFFKMATAKRFAKLCLASDGEEGKLL